MSKVTIPAGYKTPLSTYEMQRAIEFIKSNFQVNLGQALNLRRVSAPLFVREDSGLNDNLNGVERPVTFDIPDTITAIDRLAFEGCKKLEQITVKTTKLKNVTKKAFAGLKQKIKIKGREKTRLQLKKIQFV